MPLPVFGSGSRLTLLVESGALVGASLALAQVKLFSLPNGGSISLGALPLVVLAARRGLRTGIWGGVALGILAVALRATILHPVQFLLDYPLAYGMLGLAGLWAWKTPLRAFLAVLGASAARLVCHVIAGAVFFLDPSLPWSKLLLASLTYNLFHMLPEAVLVGMLAGVLVKTHKALVDRQPAPVSR